MSDRHWTIHKFGGSSLADASCFSRVAQIVRAEPGERRGVVVSAMSGMTDALLELADRAAADLSATEPCIEALGDRYAETARELLADAAANELLESWSSDAAQIRTALSSVNEAGGAAAEVAAAISGYGEVWSARLLAALLRQENPHLDCRWLDARKFLYVAPTDLGASVLWKKTQLAFDASVDPEFTGILVVTGYIASELDGQPTTLGRNGSDYSAAILAALTNADSLSIWTDVDGVMSADPRLVPESRVIGSLTYNEAMELAYFGASVIHPQTLGPVVDRGIPLYIRNSLNPDTPGTRVSDARSAEVGIKGITAINEMALINVEGTGMIGVPGTAERLFAALRGAGISVTVISQASSEHSICIAVPDALADKARQVIAMAFEEELAGGYIQRIEVTAHQSVLALVGDGMAGTPGIAARFFGTLGRAGINVRAIAQGSSERNISAVVSGHDAARALRAAHSGFYMSAKTLSIGVIGPGNVGAVLLRQLADARERLAEQLNLDLRLRGVARSSAMLLGDPQIDPFEWMSAFETDAVALDMENFVSHVNADHLPHSVLIDCTASDAIASAYSNWLAQGIHVITPNKKAFSGPWSQFETLQTYNRRERAHILYETTVGAALPVLGVVRDLVDTGDEFHSIEGVLSGTLAYLFNTYDGRQPFSDIVRSARDSGYTEPDPRDDLSGMDVARKLTILARETGQRIELNDIEVESLVPETLRDVGIDEFLARLSEYDDDMAARHASAAKKDRQLRYVARLEADGRAVIGLREVPAAHPFSNINLTDNVVRFETARYSANPLVVQGPGAGPEVTAGGVFSDLLRLAAYLSGED